MTLSRLSSMVERLTVDQDMLSVQLRQTVPYLGSFPLGGL